MCLLPCHVYVDKSVSGAKEFRSADPGGTHAVQAAKPFTLHMHVCQKHHDHEASA